MPRFPSTLASELLASINPLSGLTRANLAILLYILCVLLMFYSRTGLDMSKFPRASSLDPFDAVKPEMAGLVDSIKSLLGVNHPLLSTVAKYVHSIV